MFFTSRTYSLLLAAALALVNVGAAHAAGTAAAYAQTRKAFYDAYAAVVAGAAANHSASSADASPAGGAIGEAERNPAVTDSPELRAYPLYPYLEAARIQQALRTETTPSADADRKAEAFISAYAQAPVSRAVRRTWLDSLARREQWTSFLATYKDTEATDALRCQSFIARIELGKIEGLAADIGKQYLIPRSLPDCERPFAWMKDNGVLTTQLVEARSRLALKEGNSAFARQIIEPLPPDRAGPLLQWASLIERPAPSLDALMSSAEASIEPEILLAGWTRLARTDRDGARKRYDALLRMLGSDRERASPYTLALALALAWDREPAALDFFELVAAPDLNDAAFEWWARAAILAGKWKLVRDTIARMSDSTRQAARWRYWSARAASELHDSREAKRVYESLLAEDNYYSAMAAARLKRTLTPHPKMLTPDEALLATIAEAPALERARELFLCGMRPEAMAEWSSGYQALPEGGRLQAIALASSWGWHEQAISVAASQGIFFDYSLLYPRPYDNEVEVAARDAKVPPDLVYGIVRQESLYRTDAVSSASAMGLMQLQIDTARRTARRFGKPLPAGADLFVPSINIQLGAAHFRELLDRFDGQVPVALAGYNAGPNAARRWLPSQQPLDPDVWIENIPYNETRAYVQRILWHQVVFGWLRTHGKPQKAEGWLKPIRPVK